MINFQKITLLTLVNHVKLKMLDYQDQPNFWQNVSDKERRALLIIDNNLTSVEKTIKNL